MSKANKHLKVFQKNNQYGKLNIGTTFFKAKLQKYRIQNRVLYGVMVVSGITVKELSIRIGVHSGTVSGWIYRGVIPSLDNMERVCLFFRLPPAILFYENRRGDRENG